MSERSISDQDYHDASCQRRPRAVWGQALLFVFPWPFGKTTAQSSLSREEKGSGVVFEDDSPPSLTREPSPGVSEGVREVGATTPVPVYMISPDQLTERQVQDYILYVRDDLGAAKGTFETMFYGLKFFYLNTLGCDWALFTKKKCASLARNGCPTSARMKIVAT